MVCEEPPARFCDGDDLTVFDSPGQYELGDCSYISQTTECGEGGCVDGLCVDADPCSMISCDLPPASYCLDEQTLCAFASPGSCDDGYCTYAFVEFTCVEACSEGQCTDDPCLGVECDTPPASYCEDETTLIHWDGNAECTEGFCMYGTEPLTCADVCEIGQCDDPCEGVICSTPPPQYCVNADTLATFDAIGACGDGGICEYSVTNVVCSCEGGVCVDCEANNYDPDAYCEDCIPHYDIETDCTQCVGDWDVGQDCAECPLGYGDGGDDCGTCVVYVDDAMPDDLDNGLTWASAKKSVQAAITVAANRVAADPGIDTCDVWVAAGVYNAYVSAATDTIQLVANVHLYGGFQPGMVSRDQRHVIYNQTILDGHDSGWINMAYHVVTGADLAIIDGFTISGGYASGSNPHDRGAGMYNYQASPSVANCRFTDNFAAGSSPRGAGMYNYQSAPVVDDCTFEDNTVTCTGPGFGTGAGMHNENSDPIITDTIFTANEVACGAGDGGSGGGMYNNDSAPTVTGCGFFSNIVEGGALYGGDGGGMYCQTSTPEITDCIFEDNSANGGGGAIRDGGEGAAIITNTIFRDNAAERGGGMIFETTWGTLTSCIFEGNTASEDGGAIHSDGYGSITNVTFYGNGSTGLGSAVFFESWGGIPLVNSIVWGNLPDDDQLHYETPDNCELNYSDVAGGCPIGCTCDHVIDLDPLFMDPDNGNYKITGVSSCVDAADGDAAPEFDIEDNSRYDDPGTIDTGVGAITYADIGAYEYQGW